MRFREHVRCDPLVCGRTAKDGQPYTNTYAWFLDLRDGKVINAHAFFDSVAFNDFWRRVQP